MSSSLRYRFTATGQSRLATLAVTVGFLALWSARPVHARATPAASSRQAAKPGAWIRLGQAQGLSVPALLHLPNGNDLVVFTPAVTGSKRHYSAVQLKANGGMVAPPRNVFGNQNWGLGEFPSLVLDKGRVLLVFEGSKGDSNPKDPYNLGCLVGDLLTSSGWKLQTWSLSANCYQTDHFGATITRAGTLSATWAGGSILYRIGTAPTIPAPPPDQQILTPKSDDGSASEATETHSQDIYAAWDRFFSNPASKDGIWVANLSKKSAPAHVPGTGTNLVAHQPEPVAMASPTGKGGIFVASCNNDNPCSRVELWKYGAKPPRNVPGSSHPTSVALSAGPSGRLWIAWWSSQNGTVRVVRTNEAATAFGPVETYAGPAGCQSDGNGSVKISSGSQQRADVILTCLGHISGSFYTTEAMATQSIVPLQIAATTGFIKREKGGSVTYRVSDVGDPVQGAGVSVDGKHSTTDKKGQVTFHFTKGSAAGSFRVVASMTNYLSATTTLRIG
jgi:hypothetical protein